MFNGCKSPLGNAPLPDGSEAFRLILSFPGLSLLFAVSFDSPIPWTSVLGVLSGTLLLHLPNPGLPLGFVM